MPQSTSSNLSASLNRPLEAYRSHDAQVIDCWLKLRELALAGISRYWRRLRGANQPARGAGVDSDAVRAQVKRVLADPLFHNSKRYTNLLRYLVDKTLQGQQDALKERIIGIEVFGRTPDYDTSLDATVRVAATGVRKRLNRYYNESGRDQELRIEVPVGSYVAEFKLPKKNQLPLDALPAPRRHKLQYWYFVVPLAVVVLAFAGWKIQRRLTPVTAIDKFWAPILESSGPVLLCLSSPPNDFINSIPPKNSSGSAKPAMPLHEFSNRRSQVSITDVNAANDLASFLRGKRKDSVMRPSRGTNLSDLRSSPAVIFGNFDNEWANRLGTDLHFRFRREAELGKRWIENTSNPTNRDWALDMSDSYEQVNSDYALISRVLDPTTGQWWIGIAGLTGLGTQIAHQMLIDPKAMAAVSSGFPKNWERNNLQVVIAIKMVHGSPGASQVVASYFW